MNKITYRYWVFYINPDLIDDLSCIINPPNYIYAYTDNKDLADIFIRSHDMSKFIKKKLNLSKKEVNALAHEELNQYIVKRNLITHDSDGNKVEIECAMTKQEEKILDLQVMSALNNLVYKIGVKEFPVYMLNKDIEKALERFKFFTIVNNQITCKRDIDITSNFIRLGDKDPKIFADEVSVYVYLFHNILSEKT